MMIHHTIQGGDGTLCPTLWYSDLLLIGTSLDVHSSHHNSTSTLFPDVVPLPHTEQAEFLPDYSTD